MDTIALDEVTDEQLTAARAASSGRAAHTVYGGREHALRQTLIAIVEGHELAEHDSPAEATLQVLRGRVRLLAGGGQWEGGRGEMVVIPPERHSLTALEDAAVLLTVATGR